MNTPRTISPAAQPKSEAMNYDVGSLVRARGREWVVLPESKDEQDLLVLRPLGGGEEEITGIYLPLETVEPAEFPLPDLGREMGNHLSCGLLREAVRLGFRSGAGPFRCLARIAVEPRPYQLVPLLMALKQDPVRLLIADDVGVGKTVEACLVAREFLDRGEVHRMAVLCPPHLAEQWHRAMRDQFHLDPALVLPSTVRRLERGLGPGESLFERYPHVVVSMDFIKSERHRLTFMNHCPELVIVDEAHTCASDTGRKSAQQRHSLLQGLCKDSDRHMVLVTATPHSGKEDTFRSLLSLLDPAFLEMPLDLSGDENRKHREHLARHLIQRRRGDLESFLDIETPFPKRDFAEDHYTLHADYRALFDRVLAFCRERVLDENMELHKQRVRWWGALALLRSLASSPAATVATLRNRAASAETENVKEADEVGRREVLDLDGDSTEGIDVCPGAQSELDENSVERRKLLRLAKEVEKLKGPGKDLKLKRAATLVKKLLDDGFSPIIFCRFIPTVEYVAHHLRKTLGKKVEVAGITGNLPPEERELRVEALGAHKKRVLVCTDCLSEGINLQEWFDAVMHYDLSWNPTRHEQREGRVDRYGQLSPVARTLTYYGEDNPVDGIVLQVLLRKHKTIHKQLGIIVPVPLDTNVVVEAIFEGLLMRERAGASQLTFEFLDEHRKEVEVKWDAAVAREKASRSIYSQRSIKLDEVARELAESRRALGGGADVRGFTLTALKSLGTMVSGEDPAKLDLCEAPAAVRDAMDQDGEVEVVFSGRQKKGQLMLTRTHPMVAGLAAHVMEAALDPQQEGPARGCGVVRTRDVSTRTTLLLLRMRYHIVSLDRAGVERPLLAEDQALAGFTGSPDQAVWLDSDALEPLLRAEPHANIGADLARQQVARVLERFDAIRPHLDHIATQRGEDLLAAHRRVRKASKSPVRALRVEPHLPPDIIGVYIYLPVGGAA